METGSERNTDARFDATLGVVTHVPHWEGGDGEASAFEPYVREMRVWANLFARVEICAPRAAGELRGNQAAYRRRNITWRPVNYTLNDGWNGRLNRLVQMPGLIRNVYRLVQDTDLMLLRSPGHPALVGNLMVRVMRRRSITKWAGLFGDYEGERLPSLIERWLLGRSGTNNPVLIYGPTQSPHLISFLPALMTCEELTRARNLSERRSNKAPWSLLSVGSAIAAKGFDLAVRGLAELKRVRPTLDWTYTYIGDGEMVPHLRELTRQGGIQDRVRFAGALNFSEVQKHYADAHVMIMPGTKEGWPKTIAEAWAHGTVPVAASAGLVPWILEGDEAGLLFEPTPRGLAHTLANLLENPGLMSRLAKNGIPRAAELSLENFERRLEKVLIERFCLA